jgi:hypothetical protein
MAMSGNLRDLLPGVSTVAHRRLDARSRRSLGIRSIASDVAALSSRQTAREARMRAEAARQADVRATAEDKTRKTMQRPFPGAARRDVWVAATSRSMPEP